VKKFVSTSIFERLEIACCVSKIDLGEQASAARGEEIVVK